MRANLEDNLATRLRQKSTKFGTMTLAMTGDLVVSASGPTFLFLDPGASTRIVRMPVLEDGMFYLIRNTGTTNNLNVVDFGGTGIITFTPGKGGIVFASQFAWASVSDATGPQGPAGPTGPAGSAGPPFAGTSTSSQTIGSSGTKTFTVTPTGLGYSVGVRVRTSDAGNPTVNYMEGVVTAYNSGSGVLSFTADNSAGSGTLSSWAVNVAGDKGSTGPAGSGVSGGANHQIALFSAVGTISGGITALLDGQIIVGKSGLDPIGATVTGDVTCDNTGQILIGNTKVTYAKFQDVTALSVPGRAGNTSGVLAAITGATNQVLRVDSAGTTLGFGAIDVGQAAAVTGRLAYSNLAQGSALSVLGVTGNATANVASIVGTADQVLAVNTAGTALGFAQVQTAGIANLAVTYAKIQNVSATNRFLGRITAGSGSPEELTSANAVTIIGGNLATLQDATKLDSVFYNSHTGVATAVALGGAGTALVSTGATAAPTAQSVLQPAVTNTISKGYTLTPNSIGTMAATFTPDPTQGNYQFATNNNAVTTFNVPASDCAIDILVTNGATAGAITFSGSYRIGTTGDAYNTTNGNVFLLSIRRINAISTYIWKALQ